MPDITRWKNIVESCLSRYGRKISPDDRLDLMQDMYVAILQADEQIQKLDGFEAPKFVIKLCRSLIQERAKPRHEPADSIDNPEVAGAIEKAGEVSDAERSRVEMVRAAVGQLPEPERTLIRGIFYEDQTEMELAQHLGQSVAWVRKTKILALKKIENLLVKEN